MHSLGGLYVEEQSPVHQAKLVFVELTQSLDLPLHPRHRSFPDLNSTELVRRFMNQRINPRVIFSTIAAKLTHAVQEAWVRLEPKDWNGLIGRMPDRIRRTGGRPVSILSTFEYIYF